MKRSKRFFMGKEFDVVILSAVRSNTETEMNKRVGFLNNNNRLCVAFSRAKRLLITVGDSKTVAKLFSAQISEYETEEAFAEYISTVKKEKADALEEYLMYGGMPLAVLEQDEKDLREKSQLILGGEKQIEKNW